MGQQHLRLFPKTLIVSRFKRVVHSVASGYAVLVVSALTALISLRVANQFLNKEEFGLWGLMSSVTVYLSLIDLGMSGSVARLLIDYKDRQASGDYGSLIQTGWLVLAVQGVLIFCAGFFLAPLLCDLAIKGNEYRREFILLLRWQSAILSFGFLVRIFSHLLYAHQRFDIINYGQLGMTVINFVLLWFFFEQGQGVLSLIWANLATAIGNSLLLIIACRKLRLFPQKWGKLSWRRFKELFDYGKDMFLVSVGTQLIMFSQTFIITRNLGLSAGGTWSVGTKMFNLISQAIWKASDVSAPAFSEMMARREQSTLRERYKSMVIMTASLSGFAAISYVVCNSLFVTIFWRGKFHWPVENDCLLGIWMVVLALLHCHNGFVLMVKKIAFMRYIYFIEGVTFVALAVMVAPLGGLPAIIGASIICSVAFSGAYGIWRVKEYFGLSVKEVGLNWLKPMGKVLLSYAPFAMAVWWIEKHLSIQLRFAINILVCGGCGVFLFLRLGLPGSIHHEVLRRAPRTFVPLLRRIFGIVVPKINEAT